MFQMSHETVRPISQKQVMQWFSSPIVRVLLGFVMIFACMMTLMQKRIRGLSASYADATENLGTDLLYDVKDSEQRTAGSIDVISRDKPDTETEERNLAVLRRLKERLFNKTHEAAQNRPTSSICAGKRSTKFLTFDPVYAGGLGNFLFLTASTIGLAAASCRTALIPDSLVHSGKFLRPLSSVTNDTLQILPHSPLQFINTSLAGVYDKTLINRLSRTNSTVCLQWYLQSWRYFHPVRERIRQKLTFAEPVYHAAFLALSNRLKEYRKPIQRLIGIHVRRGDILNFDLQKLGHTPAADEYILKAYSEMDQAYKNAVFIVVSNDPPYAWYLFFETTNVIIMDQGAAEVDLVMLSLMDDLILTVGSFGWWAAYLSDAERVVYYKDWPRPGSAMDNEYRQEDYFLPGWTALS